MGGAARQKNVPTDSHFWWLFSTSSFTEGPHRMWCPRLTPPPCSSHVLVSWPKVVLQSQSPRPLGWHVRLRLACKVGNWFHVSLEMQHFINPIVFTMKQLLPQLLILRALLPFSFLFPLLQHLLCLCMFFLSELFETKLLTLCHFTHHGTCLIRMCISVYLLRASTFSDLFNPRNLTFVQ